MIWLPVTLGITISLMVAFWQRVLTWANNILAQWIGSILGPEVEEAFLFLLSSIDQRTVTIQRSIAIIRKHLASARILFQRGQGIQNYRQVIQATIVQDDEPVTYEHSESIPWYELPDDIREKFIRRQADEVAMRLELRNQKRVTNE